MLLGELHVHIVSLQEGESSSSGVAGAAAMQAGAGAANTCQIHICLEVDSYGHFFRKGRTKSVPLAAGAEARFRQELIMDVDGSQTLRILLYEEVSQGPALLRGKATFELSKSWLTEHFQDKCISLQEVSAQWCFVFTSVEFLILYSNMIRHFFQVNTERAFNSFQPLYTTTDIQDCLLDMIN